MSQTRAERFSEEFTDESTGRRMLRVTVVTHEWMDDVPRHHGDGEGWSGWVEIRREVTITEVPQGQ